jgi:2-polyprenyl-3-methyl-5-hydroxy-6-metoxy-1,4-benzoquinol methylase
MKPLQDLLDRSAVAQGRTLVVGSQIYKDKIDRRSLYADALGLDLSAGHGVDIIHDLEKPLPHTFGKFDHIDCASVLEHVARPWLFCANVIAVMNPGATILVSVPFAWRIHAYPSDYWRMSIEALPILFPGIQWIQRLYASETEIRSKPQKTKIAGNTFIERTESIAFGVLGNTGNARHIA